MNFSYLDNSATTPVCPAAYEKMKTVLEGTFGNPSSLHLMGMEAEKIVNDAREKLFNAFGAKKYGKTKPQMLIFTASGTEANNLALIGAATAKERRRGGKIIVGETEHPSVIETAKYLSAIGFKVAFIPCPRGVWDMEKYRAELSSDTILVSAMLVNNETGAVNDIASIASLAKAKNPNVLIHCDAVQGFLKIPEPLASIPADLISVSSHKIGGPKVVGALFIREKVITTKSLVPVIHGGGQESGMRSGTENTAGIAGFGAAAEFEYKNLSASLVRFKELRALLEQLISKELPDVRVNTPGGKYVPHIISLTLPDIRSETMLHFLSRKGVFVSSGSACASNTGHKSHVLLSYGMTEKEVDSTIRVSLGVQNTEEDIHNLVNALAQGISSLSRKTK
ncbi:MAG: cysteine desulfurase [Clostridia bacterium]|nr:cysteine desulfurase [Clostridia bacterium]